MSLLKRIMGRKNKASITDDQAVLINPIDKDKEPVACPVNTPIDEHQEVVQLEKEKSQELQKQKEDEQEKVIISHKEFKSLKRAKYGENHERFDKLFTIKNKKTGKVVAIRAASVIMACNTIGWRPRHVTLIEETIIDNKVIEGSEIDTSIDAKIEALDMNEKGKYKESQVEPTKDNVCEQEKVD